MANQTAQSLKSKALGDLESGKLQQALKKAQLGTKKFPRDSDFHAIAGFALTEMEQYKRSIPHFAEASRIKPDDPQFVENLANALMQTGQLPRALSYAEQKLEQFPNNKELVRVIDEIQLKGNSWRMIIDNATQRLTKDPDNFDLLATRSRAYGRIGFNENSTKDIMRAYELAPDNPRVAYLKSVNLHQSGDKEAGAKILWAILNETPKHEGALLQLASMGPRDKTELLIEMVEAAIDEKAEISSDLEFAKALLVLERDGLTAALPQFSRANAAQHDLNPYDFGKEEAKQKRIFDLFPEGAELPASGLKTAPVPIFVIGQPRSGTTLMEMMLSAIPDVAGCGELTLADDLSYTFLDPAKPYETKDAVEFAQEFRKLMPPIPAGSVAFVDKVPHNFRRVGFLLTAFPNAKVINMLRDPRDVGLSKWIRRFPAGGMRYASNLEAIAHSANVYRRYMTHWDKIFGDRILTVPYEGLVADPKTYSQNVAVFCDLEWNETMLHPDQNTKMVRTASVDQVRSKISTKSIGGWREAADHIRPMIDGFDPKLWPEYDLS